jgi:hypothetical protein
MGIYDQLQTISAQSPTPKVTHKPKEGETVKAKKEIKTNQSTSQSTDQLTNRPTDRPVHRPIDQLTNRPTDVDELGPVVEKPKAFYITKKVDRLLDEAVRYLQEKGLYKVDRSILVNALLHKPELFKPDSLDGIRSQLLAHLTNKSLKRA